MDRENVITPTGDIEALNKDMSDWQLMSFDMRKRSDDSCIEKYGRTNTELYNLLKQNIEMSTVQVEESTQTIEDINTRIDKINLANSIMYRTGEVIINPWIIDDKPDYDLETLTKRYNQYLGLFGDHKTQSDFDSQNIWGYTVHDMYQIMASKLKELESQKVDDIIERIKVSRADHDIQEQVKIVEERCASSDILIDQVMALDCLTAMNESKELSNRLETTYNRLTSVNYDYTDDMPDCVPCMTPDEYDSLNHTQIDPYEYIYDKDSIILHDEIEQAIAQFENLKYNDSYTTEESTEIRNNVVELGWNPYIIFNARTIKEAKIKQGQWFNANKRVDIIDLSEYTVMSEAKAPDSNLEPIYITLLSHNSITNKVISAVTKSEFSHSGISLDEKLTKIYSFNFPNIEGVPGFSVENLKFYEKVENPCVRVMTLFVPKSAKAKIKQNIDYYIKNKEKSGYAIKDLFNVILHKTKDTALSLNMICSQFVDSLLKLVNIDITGKSSNLVTPADFTRPNMPSKVFIMYDGPIGKYDPKLVKSKVNRLLTSNLNPDGLSILPLTEAVNAIFIEKCLDNFYVVTENKEADHILSEIRSILMPTLSIVEAKEFPLRFNHKGDMYIDLPKDLEQEYQEAHRLLTYYDESNLQGIKHELARLFYINSIIEEKLKRMKKDDPDYKKLIDLRARVLNDFKKYMKVVQKAEPNFDFEAYLKNSEYYNKTVKIDNHTLKYTGQTIKKLLKILSMG